MLARMIWRDVSPTADLGPGRYRMELLAPDSVLNLYAAHHDAMLDLSRRVAAQTDERVLIVTGGVQWSTWPGTNIPRRVLVLLFDVVDDAELEVEAAGAARAVIAVASLLAVLAVVWGVNRALISVERIAQELPDGALEDGAEAVKNASLALRVLVLGTFGLIGYAVARESGLIGGRP